jgi:Arc/MetJ-type ribon-helix-helix transcriptional regulator
MNQNPLDPNREGENQVPATTQGRKVNDSVDDVTSSFRDFVNRVPETINKAVERALNVRDSTVLLRLSEQVSESVDTLVTAGVFKNRAEAAAFLVEEGIKAQSHLFDRIAAKLEEIQRLRDELRHSLSPELK